MNVVEKVRAAIKKHEMIKDGAHIILGLSGGPDSVCLFYALMELSEELGFTIHPVHINHGLRGEDADSDQAYCQELCSSLGVGIEVFKYDCHEYAVEKGLTVEEAGRELRYDSFGKVAEELEGVYGRMNTTQVAVALAHNMDDQAETVLFRIIRGTGIDGLRGMDYVREDTRGYMVIRPLLDVSRAEIEEYLKDNGIEACIDKTNEEPMYFRNKIRLKLIPSLEEYNPRIKEALVRLAKTAASEMEALNDIADKEYESLAEKKDGKVYLEGEGLKTLAPAIKRRIVSKAFKDVGINRDATMGSFDEAMKVLSDDDSARRASIPKGLYIEDVYGKLVLGKENNNDCVNPGSNSAMSEDRVKLIVKEFRDKEPAPREDIEECVSYITCSFNEDKLEEYLGKGFSLEARGRRPGDIIKLPGGSKKIQDLLIDKKIPRDERDDAIMIASGNKVLMVITAGRNSMVIKSSVAPFKEGDEKGLFVEILVSM